MAGTIVINGRETGRPGVYSVPEFLRLQSRPPLSSILAIVGEFPFLEQNVPNLSTTQAAFDALSFSSETRKRLSNIIFDASEDPAIQSSPAGVYLVSPTATTQAFGYLQDVTPANTIKIKARQWGLEGNRTHFSIVARDPALGGWKFTARNGTYVESNVVIKAEPDLMRVTYESPTAGIRTAAAQTIHTDAGAKTFTRDAGSFITDGFYVGQVIPAGGFTGSAGNTGSFTITAVTALVLTVAETVATVAGSGDERIQGAIVPTGFVGDDTDIPGHVSGVVRMAVADGSVNLTFSTVIDETFVYANGTTTVSWWSEAPVDGILTFKSNDPATTTNPLEILVTGINKETGLTATETVTWSKADIENNDHEAGKAVTTTRFTGPVSIHIQDDTGATDFVGQITISGNVFPTFSAADGQTYVGNVIQYIANYASVGFSPSTESTRTSSAKLEDLDDLSATALTTSPTTTAALTADLWKIVTTINNKSLLVEAERLTTDDPPVITTTATSFFLAGGTETTATATDWEDALAELRWYDVDVLVPFYDPTNTAAADDTILPKVKEHIETMWADGANERIAWFPVGDDETYAELLARVNTFGDYRISMPVDGVSMVQYNNQSEDLRPHWTAVLMAAMDASTNGLIPFTWRSPRITSSVRNTALYSSEAVEEMIQSGLLFFTEPPGRAPQVERDTTTFIEQDDPRRTERVSVRSLMLSLKFMRAALRRFIVSADGSIATLADVRGGVVQELERQKNFRIFKSYDPNKIVVTPSTDRYDVAYEFVPLYPINFIVLRAKVTAPVPIT